MDTRPVVPVRGLHPGDVVQPEIPQRVVTRRTQRIIVVREREVTAAGAEGRSLQTGGKRIELFYIVRLRYRDRNIAAAQAVPESVQQGRTDDTAPLPAGVWCAARCDNKTRVTAQIE